MRYFILVIAMWAPLILVAENHEKAAQVVLPEVFWLRCTNGLFKIDRLNEVFAQKKPTIASHRLCENDDKIYADKLNTRCLEGVPIKKYFSKWTGKFIEFNEPYECAVLVKDFEPLFK